jgi:hypothetical protein
MSGQLLKEISANVIQGGSFIGELQATNVTADTAEVSTIKYLSSGTTNFTTVSTTPSQAGNSAITWPGFNPSGGQVLSAVDTTGALTWATALTATNPLLTVDQRIRVKQNPGVGEYLFITDALNSITDASVSKPYFVEVGPGVYTEGNMTIPSYVTVVGMTQNSVVVVPTASAHTFIMSENSSLADISITGATTTGFACVAMNGTGKCYMDRVSVTGPDIGFLMDATGSNVVTCVATNIKASQTVSNAVLVRNTGGSAIARMTVEVFEFNDTATATSETILEVNGANSTLVMISMSISLNEGEAPYGTAMLVQNGGTLKTIGGTINRYALGLDVPSDGGSPGISVNALDIFDVTQHVNSPNPNTDGYFFTEVTNLNLITINNSSAFRIANTDNREVTVAIKGGNFTSVSTALAYVTAQTPTDVAPWFIRVGPGSFTESNPLVIPKYVHVEGAGFATTHIIASNNSLNLFELGGSVIHISDFATHGPTLASAIFYTGDFTADFLRFTLIHRVDLNGCKHGVYLTNTTGVCACDLISVSNGGVGGNYDGTVTRSCITIDQATGFPFTCIFNDLRISIPPGQAATGTPPFTSYSGVDMIGTSPNPQMQFVFNTVAMFQLDPAVGTVGIGMSFENAIVELGTVLIKGFDRALLFKASTLPSSIGLSSLNTSSNNTDALIETNTVSGAIRVTNGSLANIDDSAAPNHDLSFLVQGPVSEGVTFTGPVNMGSTLTTTTPILPSIQHSGTTTGLLTGGNFTLTGGLGIQVAIGDGYVTGTDEGDPTYVSWTSNLTDTMPVSSDRFVSVTSVGAIQLTPSPPGEYAAILIARVKSDGTGIVFVERIERQALHTPTLIDNTLREAFGPIVASGIIGSAGTGAFKLSVGSGKYFYSTHAYSPSGGTDITFTPIFHSGGTFVSDTPVNVLSAANARRYDDGTDLVALGGGNWVKHALYILNDGTHEIYLFIYGQTEFASQSAAENGALPLQPAFVGENLAAVSGLVLGDVSTDWITVQDIRPTLQFTAAGVTATTDHGSLTGLLDDDHTQYLLVSGSRSMTGALNLGTNNITNPGTIDGVTITDMSDRLRPGGADELPTATGTTITALTNGTGASTSLARADHSHAHGVQTDVTLHAAATGGVNGFMPGSDKTKLDASTPASTVSTLVERDGAGSISLDGMVIDGNGSAQFSNSGDTFHVSVQAPAALGADYTLTLPPNDGDATQFLQTDGAGVTTWVTPPGGFTNPMTTAGDLVIRNAGNTDDRLAIGTATNQVLTVGATGVPAWQTVGAAMDPTVSQNIVFFDDFFFGAENNWLTSRADRALPYDAGEGNAMGIIQLSTVTGSAANSQICISGNKSFRGGLGTMVVKTRVLFQNLSGGGQNSEVFFGVGDTDLDSGSTIAISNGAIFYIQDDAEVQIRTAGSATLTSQATSPLQTVVVDTWYVAEIRVTAAAGTWTNVEFLWDGVSVGDVTTNLPNAVSQSFAPQIYIRKTAGNNAHSILIDYYYINFEMNAVR